MSPVTMDFVASRDPGPHTGLMENANHWTSAAVIHAAFAIACITMAASALRRSRWSEPGAILLVALLATLSAFFVAAGTDAWLHSLGGPRFTSWTLASVILGNTAAAICIHFFWFGYRPVADATDQSRVQTRVLELLGYGCLALYLYRVNRAGWMPEFLEKGTIAFPAWLIFGIVPAMFGIGIRAMADRGRSGLTQLNLSGERPPLLSEATIKGIRLLATSTFAVIAADAAALVLSQPLHSKNLVLYTVVQLAMLPGIAGVVYFQTRATFFDVAIKRGATLAVFCILALILVNAAPLGAAFGVGGVLAAYTIAVLHEQFERFVDRVLLGRPDYRAKLTEITAGIARSNDPATLVTRELAESLQAQWVRFGESPDPRAATVPAVASAGRHFGFLSVAERKRGLRYQSEDATFLEGVAAQLAAALDGREARTERQLAAEAESRSLRAQINPHFLFNSLNSLADMVKSEPRAERAVLDLARVFRHALDSTRQPVVPLGDELRFLDSYLRIEQIRFEERLRFEIDCPESLLDTPVPPMLLQPLVENSIRHGIAAKIEGGSVRVGAELDGRRIRLTVTDTGAGFEPRSAGRGGVGVESVRRRVELLPGGRFEISSTPGEGTRAVLEWEVA